MSFLHVQSCECIKSELDLFALPSTQTSIEGGQWIHYKPLSSLTDDSPIEFVIPGQSNEYIDLSQTMIHMKVKVVKQDGNNLTDDISVGPVNNFIHSLFSQVDVYLNQKLISPPSNTYAYRAYIETLLNYGKDAKHSHLTCGLWFNDTPKYMDDLQTDNNKGLAKRKEYITNSKQLELIGHVHSDIFNQEKFLINGVEMRVKFVRSRDSFCLLTNADQSIKINIMEATLLIRKAKINPTVLIAHSKGLEISTAKYPITRTDVKVLTIPAGVQGKSMDNVFLGQLPKRCIIGFVSNAAFNGDLKKNPFNFQHYKMNFFFIIRRWYTASCKTITTRLFKSK